MANLNNSALKKAWILVSLALTVAILKPVESTPLACEPYHCIYTNILVVALISS